MTQPEERGAGELKRSVVLLKKKAVIKDLEFPVAFELPLKGIMAASGFSCGSKKKGFGQKHIPDGYSLGPKSPLQIMPSFLPHIQQNIAEQRFCTECLPCQLQKHPTPALLP